MTEDCPHCGHENLDLFEDEQIGPVLPFHAKPGARGKPGEQVMCPAGGSPIEIVREAVGGV